jgi:hypothetical protein
VSLRRKRVSYTPYFQFSQQKWIFDAALSVAYLVHLRLHRSAVCLGAFLVNQEVLLSPLARRVWIVIVSYIDNLKTKKKIFKNLLPTMNYSVIQIQ